MQRFLIVGLGNPGPSYVHTRHNFGFQAVDFFCRETNFAPYQHKFNGDWAKQTWQGKELAVLRPMTFMNLSGESVGAAIRFLKLRPRCLLVLHDDLDIPFGEIRIKDGGGHAGHKGIQSLIQHLGSSDFARIRLGIGRPPAGFSGSLADFVLQSFGGEERQRIPAILEQVMQRMCGMLENGAEEGLFKQETR
ncbi:aminoacyl-tRNA hydrolase [Pajaroellobacter abortibovis]|uniref:Peptidyl-tRNA hydrolase n=1 Tax=Pajaroellobacter abortibovis TaxID=1882918 RepID=A0A1L6MXJ6_9BACT|nr:aminoacyl-tRNA hydrolase [Pajaroellobacter abortibovis]APS00311.1 aminoacyl-tRNA hydrolase [Pajaroellobacter abortibovis]